MATTNQREREKALAWLTKRLRWERTLADLRAGRPKVQRKAA